jgi:hypothetical protein
MKTIIVYGLRRSGNHLFISTILQNFKNFVHINNNQSFTYANYIKYKDIHKNKERIDLEWTGFKNVDCVLISLENEIIDNNELEYFKKINNLNVCVLIRCPYCNFSSIWKVYKQNKLILLEIIKLWKIYAEYFKNNNDYIKVLYDEFSTNDNYLYNILNKLGIKNKNIDRNIYITHQMSSFQGNPQNTQQVYKTLDTCVYKDDESFCELVRDPEIENLWNSIKKLDFLIK